MPDSVAGMRALAKRYPRIDIERTGIYMVRRRGDYFVKFLMGAEPPANYEIKPPRAR